MSLGKRGVLSDLRKGRQWPGSRGIGVDLFSNWIHLDSAEKAISSRRPKVTSNEA